MNGFQQASALPFRREGGRVEFCLITSSAGRWVFPKGAIDPGETTAQTALKEAFEEAGLHGQVVGQPLGWYRVRKHGRGASVLVWLMEVTQSDVLWREADRRKRRWVTESEARQLLSHPALRTCLDAAVGWLNAA